MPTVAVSPNLSVVSCNFDASSAELGPNRRLPKMGSLSLKRPDGANKSEGVKVPVKTGFGGSSADAVKGSVGQYKLFGITLITQL